MADRAHHQHEPIRVARSLPVSPQAAGEAREWAAGTLIRWGMPDVADDMRTVITELVANAVQAGAREISALIEWHQVMDHVDVLVRDDGAGEPRPREPDFAAERGRGLFLVAMLCAEWGHHPAPDGGKVVWARLPLKDT